MSPELKDVVLELIANHNGQWGWLQLDRAFSAQGMLGIHIPILVEVLTKDGFLVVEGDPARASGRFKITNAGLMRLRQSGPLQRRPLALIPPILVSAAHASVKPRSPGVPAS